MKDAPYILVTACYSVGISVQKFSTLELAQQAMLSRLAAEAHLDTNKIESLKATCGDSFDISSDCCWAWMTTEQYGLIECEIYDLRKIENGG